MAKSGRFRFHGGAATYVGTALLGALITYSAILLTQGIELWKRKRAHESLIHALLLALHEEVESLLDMARVISGKLRLDLKTVNLKDVVSAAIDVMTPAAKASSATGTCAATSSSTSRTTPRSSSSLRP